MRKILLVVLVVLLLLLGGYLVINKIQIGSLEILGVKGIKTESETLGDKITQASKLASADYQSELANLNTSLKTLKNEREAYEDLVTLSNNDEISPVAKFEKYEIEYIWTRIGNHATSEGVVMKLEVTRGSSSTQGLYDLKFTVNGDYIGITDFIYDIENDTSLGFKIEDFKIIPGESVEDLVATFNCKDININIDENKMQTQNQQTVPTDTQAEVDTVSTVSTTANTTVTTSTTDDMTR